jgi:hypothetical protein
MPILGRPYFPPSPSFFEVSELHNQRSSQPETNIDEFVIHSNPNVYHF